jgi:hypothetical protein
MTVLVAHAGHWAETIAMVSPAIALPIALAWLIRSEKKRANARH